MSNAWTLSTPARLPPNLVDTSVLNSFNKIPIRQQSFTPLPAPTPVMSQYGAPLSTPYNGIEMPELKYEPDIIYRDINSTQTKIKTNPISIPTILFFVATTILIIILYQRYQRVKRERNIEYNWKEIFTELFIKNSAR